MLPLHVACLHGSQGCLEVLLDVMSSSQVKTVDDFDRSAMHAAAVSGYMVHTLSLSLFLTLSVFHLCCPHMWSRNIINSR